MSEPPLLTEDQAAERLLMSPRSLRKLRQEGAIRYVNTVGRKVAYRREDCDAFVETRTRLETPVDLPAGRIRGRARPRRQDDGNVLSFTARRQARQQGLGG
jgi:excisionase family DNA binding protein